MAEAEAKHVLRVFPGPPEEVPLRGLYLSERFRPQRRPRSFTYANFIASLDGRISLPDSRATRRTVPPGIANERDWRLFQELAACADALITTGRYVRDLTSAISARSFPVSGKPAYADLLEWRRARGLAPQPAVVIVTSTMDLPPLGPLVESGRSVYAATGAGTDQRRIARVESQGVRVLRAGEGTRVEAGRLIEALAHEGRRQIALIGGGEVLHALIADDVLDRVYLTLACRMLGGLAFDTLLTGSVLEPPARFKLHALHYDGATGESEVEQLFAIFDRGGLVEPRAR